MKPLGVLASGVRDVPELLTVEETAKILHLDIQTIRRMFRTRELPGLKLGGTWRISKERLIAHLDEQQRRSDGLDGCP